MKDKHILFLLIAMAIGNLLFLSQFSIGNAISSTAIGLFFSVTWFLVVRKVLADKHAAEAENDVVEKSLRLKDYLLLAGPGVIFYISVCGVAIAVYILS